MLFDTFPTAVAAGDALFASPFSSESVFSFGPWPRFARRLASTFMSRTRVFSGLAAFEGRPAFW